MDVDDELIGGRYALGELLGVGGTGSVFAAIDVDNSGMQVAVKILHPHLCTDHASRAAFLREAEHVINVRHPNIVRVHAIGMHDAGGVIMPWIGLDLLHGPTLREHVERHGPLTTTDAAAVVEGILNGLAAAHAVGIVHRDISPQNVILDGPTRRPDAAISPDMVRIIDFGLADITGQATLGSDVLLAGSAGADAGVVGNASFMSPEQAQGRPVRSVSDLYQTGAVLYFALTSRTPFPRDTTAQTLHAHVSAPPPVPSAIAPSARAFDRIVTRAMAKTPAHRYRDADAFRIELREIAQLGVSAQPQKWVFAQPEDGIDEPAAVARYDATGRTRVLSGTGDSSLQYLGRPQASDSNQAAIDSRSRGGIAAVAITVVILALAGWAVGAATATPTDSDVQPTSTPSSAVEAPVAPSPSAAPPSPPSPPPTVAPVLSPPPIQIIVPTLYGTLADAQKVLADAGLVLGTVTRVESPEPGDRVLAQIPVSGDARAPGAPVDITVASGNNGVPQIAGMSYAAAAALIESAGFTVSGERPATAASAIVTHTQPEAGTVVRVGTSVGLVLVDSTPTPRPTEPTSPPTKDSA